MAMPRQAAVHATITKKSAAGPGASRRGAAAAPECLPPAMRLYRSEEGFNAIMSWYEDVLAASSPEISLDLADRLCVAAEAHVSACRLVWPDGRVTSYLS